MDLRPATTDDVDALLALDATGWDRPFLEGVLADVAHERGRNTRVAERDGVVVGFVGWVTLGLERGELYVHPLAAADPDVAAALLDAVAAEARERGATRIRAGTSDGDAGLAEALAAAGFGEVFAFLEMELPLAPAGSPAGAPAASPDGAPAASPAAPSPLDPFVLVPDPDPAALAALNNAAFAGVDNAPPIPPEHAAELWAAPSVWHAASGVWADAAGRYVAYAIMTRAGEVESIAVHPDARGRGLAGRILARVVAVAAASGVPRLRSVVASTNAASLALHARAGFVEIGRRRVWQKEPGAAGPTPPAPG